AVNKYANTPATNTNGAKSNRVAATVPSRAPPVPVNSITVSAIIGITEIAITAPMAVRTQRIASLLSFILFNIREKEVKGYRKQRIFPFYLYYIIFFTNCQISI